MSMSSTDRGRMVLDLFDTYYRRIYLFARRSLPAEQAEDVAQEVFFRLLKSEGVERKQITASYLIKIADNLIKSNYQRSQRLQRYREYESRRHDREWVARAAPRSHAFDPDELASALQQLSGDERDAVRMIVCQGMTYEDAARSLGVNATTVNNWKHRGLRKLREQCRERTKCDDARRDPSASRRSRSERSEDARIAGTGDRGDAPGRIEITFRDARASAPRGRS